MFVSKCIFKGVLCVCVSFCMCVCACVCFLGCSGAVFCDMFLWYLLVIVFFKGVLCVFVF